MKNANWTRILTILLAVLAAYAILAIGIGIVQKFFAPILLVLLAAILAYILTPVVDRLQAGFHMPRLMAILLTYVFVGAVLAGLGFALTAPLISQTRSLVDAVKDPTHLENVVSVQQQTAKILATSRRYENGVNSSGLCSVAPLIQGRPPECGVLRPSAVTLQSQLRTLRRQLIPALLKSNAVRGSGTSSGSTNRHSHTTIVSVTPVPLSYAKSVAVPAAKLVQTVNRAKRHLDAGAFNAYASDAAAIYKGARSLHSDAKHLYSTVKSTPVIILGLQTRIDQHHVPLNLRSLFGQAVGKVSGQSATVLNNAVTILTSTINVIFDVFIVLVMSFYLLADGGRFISWVMGIVPDRNREQAWFFIKSLDSVLGGYIRGQLIVAITIGILAGVGSYFLGVPYAVLIGLFAFLAESVPVLGPVLASIPAILVSLFTQSIFKTLLVIAWFVIVQQIEQNVVGPRITGHAVGIHPVVAMVALLIGFEVGGFWGAFLAVPVTGLLQVVVGQGYNYFVLQRPLPTAAVPENLDVPEDTQDHSHSPPAAE
jgi:predicted PurR-regulated permease PerM